LTDLRTRSWQGIRAEAMRRINERIWPPGELIPGEVELAEEFGCARATVNRALRELADEGLLERRRKAGTRVVRDPVRKARLDIAIIRLEVEGRGMAYRFDLLEEGRAKPPAGVAAAIGLAGRPELMHLRTLHLADDRPFAYEDRWLDPRVVPEIDGVDLGTVSINEWLVRNVPYSYGDIALSAANADAQEAAHLGTGVGAALFVVERTTWKGDAAVTAVRLAYAPGYRLKTVV
jgi:GntR family histidine utilization transcriptional repressor